ncbi:MAG: hydrogenase iron-sulfur subunit [Deltaproteobacteria bacterium]|nr:hydrogenase iron-sulfur subunit [Deltaproteobacteria bacterium]
MNKKIFIFGNGSCAHHLAKEFLSSGADVILATTDNAVEFSSTTDLLALEILTDTKLLSCRGGVGNFTLTAVCNGERVTKRVDEIIIAEEDRREPNFSLYGLTATSNVISQSRMKTLLLESSHEESILSKVKTVVFFLGFVKESNPVITEEMMHLAANLQSGFNVQTYILTKNLKVAGNGLEALYRKTKETGTVYIKFADVMPDIYQEKKNDIRIEFFDEITSKNFRLSPDITVVDETIVPFENAARFAGILNVDTDPVGFVQADNVHRYRVLTNRNGIMVAGPSRSIQNRCDQIMDAENVALASAGIMMDRLALKSDRAEIDTGQCIRCLTCYRLCPYHAITLNARVTVVPDACEGCGICVAWCPRGAVRIKDLEPGSVLDEIDIGTPVQTEKVFTPSIVAFCCSRSSARAGELAMCMGHHLPLGLKIIEVPCAGSISYAHIFAAFQNHADGVLVAACHKGNCHSERGNIYAEQTVERIKEVFSQIGFEKDRLLVQTLASNMGTEFARIVNRFEETIVKLGPSRLKKGQVSENRALSKS